MPAYFVLSLALVGSSACPGSGYLGPCPADMNGDGTVGVSEFLELLAAWGPNPCARADLDGNREVGVTDFLELLAQFGPCPPTNIVPISACEVLDQAGTTYVLQADLPTVTDTCFSITADDVILDGNGHTITGDDEWGDHGVNAIGRRRLVIRNLTIADFGRGINLVDTDDSLIEGNDFESIRLQAVYLDQHSDRNTIRDNSVASADYAGIQVAWGGDNAIRCNTIINSGFFAGISGAVFLGPSASSGNTIADNNMIADGGMAAGILVKAGSDETCVIGNTVINAYFDAMDLNSDNNHIQDNTVDNTLGSGDTITLRGGASGNTLIDNSILGGHSGYRLNGFHDSVIRGGEVEGTGVLGTSAAIVVKGPCSGITFDGVTILEVLAEELRVEDLINDFHLIDTLIGSYTIGPGLADGLVVEDSADGLIRFLAPVSGSGAAFSSDIQVSFNSAIVDASTQSGLDSPAEITLRGLSVADPVILRDGEECPPEDGCTLLSYEGGTAVFRVESWWGSRTEYSIGERP